MKVDIKKYLLEITVTKKTKKDLEQEELEKSQETSKVTFNKETEEKIKYCKFLKQNILKKGNKKMYRRIIIYIVFFTTLYWLISTRTFNLDIFLAYGYEKSVIYNFEETIIKLIELLEIPMVLFLLFNMAENEIQDKKVNYDRKCKFIEVAQPLYINGILDKLEDKSIKEFYEKIINDNFEENDKDRPI